MGLEEIYDRFNLVLGEQEIDIADVKENIEKYTGKIVLYGAGSAGIAFFNYLKDAGIEVNYFADGDIQKHGQKCLGVDILSPASITSVVGKDALVIVTINTDGKNYCKDFKQALLEGGHKGLHKSLLAYGCNNVIDYTYFRRCYSLFKGEKYNLPACSDVYLMKENWKKIVQVYNWLCSDISKETFLKILEFRMLDDNVIIPTYPEKNMYFEYDLFDQIKNEIFIDCGACTGSSLKDFLRINGDKYEKCISIEPDRYNYAGLLKYVSELGIHKKKIETINSAVYSHDGEERFFELLGPGTFAAKDGNVNLNTITIDSVLCKKPATYIKMNIEGSEVEALKGAKYTITNFKPRMAIMGYHKTSDLWEVPYIIKKYNINYNLYLRSYMHNIAFAYYAC